MRKYLEIQYCIPVGCVPPARRPYLPGSGGVYLVRGMYLIRRCVPGLEDVPGWEGVPGPRGMYLVWWCTWSGGWGVPGPGGCTWSGGVPGPGGVYLVPPVNRITHTCKNITLPQLRCGR